MPFLFEKLFGQVDQHFGQLDGRLTPWASRSAALQKLLWSCFKAALVATQKWLFVSSAFSSFTACLSYFAITIKLYSSSRRLHNGQDVFCRSNFGGLLTEWRKLNDQNLVTIKVFDLLYHHDDLGECHGMWQRAKNLLILFGCRSRL